MKIGVLTSSRADFGIYLPLLQRLKQDSFFNLEIIAFGTHLSKYHGYTLSEIEKEGFPVIHKISSLLTNDDENSIATAYGLTVIKFSDFWETINYDLVLCLGDRFEMSAAVQAGVPFGIRFAHFCGGETTLGAIDNVFRHQITLASILHFPTLEKFKSKIANILGTNENIHSVGSLSIEEIESLPIPSENRFRETYNIQDKFALLTFHPETISPQKNKENVFEMQRALDSISQDILLVITMPNSDTFGTVFREALIELREKCPDQLILIENFGKLNYFAAMRYCELMIGNTSSGIVEAASFNKYVINVGDRQKGRDQSDNIVNVPFDSIKIREAFYSLIQKGNYLGNNIYFRPKTIETIVNYLRTY